MPPVPSGPVSMQSHQRRESTQSNHTETGPSHLGQSQRSGMRNPVRGGHQNYGPSHHQNYQQSHQYNNNGYNGRGGYGGPNQNRGQPPNMGQQPYGGPAVQGYPNSPRNIHRSPAMSHASPSLATVQPMVTPQLYPPQQQQYMPPQAVSYILSPRSESSLLSVVIATVAGSPLFRKLEGHRLIFEYFLTIFAVRWSASLDAL